MAKTKEYKVIYATAITVDGIRRAIDEVFSAEETHEVKVLVARKYIALTGGK